jgi:RNA polymerase sigma factor FliA
VSLGSFRRVKSLISCADGETRDLAAYIPLVRRLAGVLMGTVPASVSKDDLEQEGMIALCSALARFDQSEGASVEGYVAPRIRGAMLDYLRNLDWAPRAVRAMARRIETEKGKFHVLHGRFPSVYELAQAMGVPEQDIYDAISDSESVVMLMSEFPEDSDFSYLLPDLTTPDTIFHRKQRLAVFTRLYEKADRPTATAVSMALDGVRIDDIAVKLSVSSSRVVQLLAAFVAKLDKSCSLEVGPPAKQQESSRDRAIDTWYERNVRVSAANLFS